MRAVCVALAWFSLACLVLLAVIAVWSVWLWWRHPLPPGPDLDDVPWLDRDGVQHR